jgi:hypothetical protein
MVRFFTVFQVKFKRFITTLANQLNQLVATDYLFAHKHLQAEDVALRNRKQYFNGREQTDVFLVV